MHKPSVRSVGCAAAVVFMAFSVAWAQPPTCEVTDPIGDFLHGPVGLPDPSPCVGLPCLPYLDIGHASITNNGGVFSINMTLAGEIPAMPTLRPGAKRMIWWWNLNTDPTTSPKGYPFDPGTISGADFVARIIWDGASFSGEVIDRRPLLTGGEANLVPVPFQVNGSVVGVVVDGAILGNPTSIVFNAVTRTYYTANDGTDGLSVEDRTVQTRCGW